MLFKHYLIFLITLLNSFDVFTFVAERQLYREKLGDVLTDKILYIAEVMNRQDYLPHMPSEAEVDLIFDTTYPDVQPYLFKVSLCKSKCPL